MDTPPDDLEALLAGMRDEFLDTAADRVSAIAADAEGLALSAEPAASLARLIRHAHTLKGGGATFGFPSLSEAGADVERAAKTLLAAGQAADRLDDLHHTVAALRGALAALPRRR